MKKSKKQFNGAQTTAPAESTTTDQPALIAQAEKPAEATKPRASYVDFKKRAENRQLPTERVLELLKRWMPRQWELAEVVGKWIWIQFSEPPAEPVRQELSQLGFHWNTKRQAWQHPCGQFTSGTPKNPREKYGSHFAADLKAA